MNRLDEHGLAVGQEDDQEKREARRRRYDALLAMMREWAADESGYEERVWPEFKRQIEANRMSNRRRFCD